MPTKATIWIRDDVGGRVPLTVDVSRVDDRIVLKNELITIWLPTEAVVAALGDEGHG